MRGDGAASGGREHTFSIVHPGVPAAQVSVEADGIAGRRRRSVQSPRSCPPADTTSHREGHELAPRRDLWARDVMLGCERRKGEGTYSRTRLLSRCCAAAGAFASAPRAFGSAISRRGFVGVSTSSSANVASSSPWHTTPRRAVLPSRQERRPVVTVCEFRVKSPRVGTRLLHSTLCPDGGSVVVANEEQQPKRRERDTRALSICGLLQLPLAVRPGQMTIDELAGCENFEMLPPGHPQQVLIS